MITLYRSPRPHLAGPSTFLSQREGVLIYGGPDRTELAETITAEHPDGRRWMCTRHEARSHGGVYWLATPLRQDDQPDLPRGSVHTTQYQAPSLAALVAVLERVAAEPYIAPLREVGSVTPTRPIARPGVAAGAEHSYPDSPRGDAL